MKASSYVATSAISGTIFSIRTVCESHGFSGMARGAGVMTGDEFMVSLHESQPLPR